jgi:hypothetical protein
MGLFITSSRKRSKQKREKILFMEDSKGFVELAKLINRGSFHGQDLVLALEGIDKIWRAEVLLADAEKEGLIERGKLEPTREQVFFGVGGFHGHKCLNSLYASTVCYHWITKTTEYL